MSDDGLVGAQPTYSNDTDSATPPDTEYSLGEPAERVYQRLQTNRQQVIDRGREMAELTIPAILPPLDYITGDNLPGNNQSTGAYCVNNLASKLMLTAFPPGLPFFTAAAIEYEVQQEITQNPDLWANLQLAFAGLERAHRQRMETTPLKTVYIGAIKLALISGNWLWRHTSLDNPTFYPMTHYVCKRDGDGQVFMVVLKECADIEGLPEDVKAIVYRHSPEKRNAPLWHAKADIYSCSKLKGKGKNRSWLYWQEYCGEVIPGTEVETDFDEPVMSAEWLIPIFGQDWGLGYCEEYRGDLYACEAWASAITDGGSLASLALLFVKPGSPTSVNQVREARNLSTLSGEATDLTMFRTDKQGDFSFLVQQYETADRRLSRAFLNQSSVQRSGERVTAEEIKRLGNELDQAMGGIYTMLSQGFQRRVVMRFMALNEEENPKLPALPKGIVKVQVVAGTDNMGNSQEVQSLTELGQGVQAVFGPQFTVQVLNGANWTARMAAAKGIKPDGLVNTQAMIDAKTAAAQKQAMQQEVMSKAAGPVAGHLAGAAAQHLAPPPGGAQGQPQAGPTQH